MKGEGALLEAQNEDFSSGLRQGPSKTKKTAVLASA